MLFYYLKQTIRLLLRNPFFTIVNVTGLAIGFAAFFVLWPFSQNELNSDTQWKEHKDIYRYTSHWSGTEYNTNWDDKFGAFLSDFLKKTGESHSQIYAYTRLKRYALSNEVGAIVSVSDKTNKKQFKENYFFYADANLFDFFGIELLEGRPDKVLAQSQSVVISRTIARKYFGTEEVVGKIISVNDTSLYTITGVFQDLPHNSHLNFELVASEPDILDRAGWNLAYGYYKIKEGTDIAALSSEMDKYIHENYSSRWDWSKTKEQTILQPIATASFEDLSWNGFTAKSKAHLVLLGVVGIVILIMAWINYSSLTLSSIEERLKEIATRKTAGAASRDLFKQFITESIVVNVIAIFFAMTIVQLSKPLFEILLHFYILPWSEPEPIFYLYIFLIIGGGVIFSGLYPALVAVRHNPRALFNKHKLSGSNSFVHRWLPVMQFVTCIVLITLVLISRNQTDFILRKGFGVNQKNVVVIDLPILHQEEKLKSLPYFVNQLNANAFIKGVTISSSVPSDIKNVIGDVAIRRTKNSGSSGNVNSDGGVDENFISFFDIKLLHGRNFLPDNPADSSSVIISLYATVKLGFSSPDKAVGEWILLGDDFPCQIIGVMEEYLSEPLTEFRSMRGSCLTYKNALVPWMTPAKVSFRVNGDNFEETIAAVESLYKEAFNDDLFDWRLLEQQVKSRYDAQLTARNQIFVFTSLAIVIGGMGLLGMVSFKILRKTKEIGIRKVLGATFYQITFLLLKTTLQQIVIATAIAIPIAYFYTNQYLQGFTEHVELQWWHFAIPVVMLILIMLGTVEVVVWRAARSHPVKALRHE